MKLTLNIDTSSNEARELIRYIRSLKFVEITEEPVEELTTAQKTAIDLGIESLENGKFTHKDVMDSTKARFPHLFEKRT